MSMTCTHGIARFILLIVANDRQEEDFRFSFARRNVSTHAIHFLSNHTLYMRVFSSRDTSSLPTRCHQMDSLPILFELAVVGARMIFHSFLKFNLRCRSELAALRQLESW